MPKETDISSEEREVPRETTPEFSETVEKTETEDTAEREKGATKTDLSRFRLSRMLDALALWLYTAVVSGFFGTLFTAYSTEENFFRRRIEKRKKQRRVHIEPKYNDRRVASVTEKVFFAAFLRRLRYTLLNLPIAYYANAICVYAFSALVTNFLVTFLSGAPSLSEGHALSAYALESLQAYVTVPTFWVNLSILLFFGLFTVPIRKRTLQEIKRGSLFLSSFFERLLGAKSVLTEDLRNGELTAAQALRREHVFVSVLVLLGAALGVLSAFVSPLLFLVVAMLVLFGAIICRTPEAGLVLAVLFIPVMAFSGRYDSLYMTAVQDASFGEILKAIGFPACFLAALVLFTGIAYTVKVLRKKRLFRFRLIDAAILLFAIVFLLFGVVTAPDRMSVSEIVVSTILLGVYFLAVNLLRTEAWIDRVLAVIQFTVLLSLSAGIVVHYFGVPDLGWLSTEHLSGEIGSVAALFGGEKVLGAYLVLMLPLSLGTMCTVRSAACKIISAMALPEILFVAILLPSKLPLIFCLFGLCVFALLCTYKTIYTVPIALGAASVVYQLVPNGTHLTVFLKSFIKDAFGQSIFLWDRLFTTAYELSFLGEGLGQLRFQSLFGAGDPYREAGFWMRALIGGGIQGILAILALIFLFLQMSLETLKLSRGIHMRIGLVGAFTSIAVLFPYGIFMPIFTDFRITFLFWLIVGLAASYCQLSEDYRSDRSFLRQDPMSTRNADTIVY